MQPITIFFLFHLFVLLLVLDAFSLLSACCPLILSCSISLSCSLSPCSCFLCPSPCLSPHFSALFPLWIFCSLSLCLAPCHCFFSHSISVLQLSASSPSLSPAAHPRLSPLHLCPAACLLFLAAFHFILPPFSLSVSPCLAPCPCLSVTICPAPCPFSFSLSSAILLPVFLFSLSFCPSTSFSTFVLLPVPVFSVFISLSHCLSSHFLLQLPIQPALPFFLSLLLCPSPWPFFLFLHVCPLVHDWFVLFLLVSLYRSDPFFIFQSLCPVPCLFSLSVCPVPCRRLCCSFELPLLSRYLSVPLSCSPTLRFLAPFLCRAHPSFSSFLYLSDLFLRPSFLCSSVFSLVLFFSF
ncbi:uncharacterized protein [Nyctibius grandis]|uniref:uncharacterized protein n=1 Tax=Nyctibius grandis TaxID=48427 RepID=UPI0035BC466C